MGGGGGWHSEHRYQMEGSCQLHAPAALLRGKASLIPIDQKAVWVAEPVWTLLRRKILLPLHYVAYLFICLFIYLFIYLFVLTEDCLCSQT
jgi:hypothetical protein